jgi:hypothetical protein
MNVRKLSLAQPQLGFSKEAVEHGLDRRLCVIRASIAHMLAIEKVSTQSLRKTGIFRAGAGDFREILAEVADF